jgi:hypothetical protein
MCWVSAVDTAPTQTLISYSPAYRKSPNLSIIVGSLSLRNCACKEEHPGKAGDHSANKGPHRYSALFQSYIS